MSNEERALRAFLTDLVAVCQKHSMAVFNQDEYGMALIRWGGWEDDYRVNPAIDRAPVLTLNHITPDGGIGDSPSFCPVFHADGSL